MRTRMALILLALALILTLCLYFPGLSGGFIFDDGPRIKSNRLLAIDSLEYVQLKQAFFSSSDEFPSNRPLSMLSFGMNHALSGLKPAYFKLTNLIIHLWVGLMIFFLVRLLVSTFAAIWKVDVPPERVAWMGLAVSVAWLVHPINLTPALYTVQRMTSLSALFSIHALICYVAGRRRMLEGKPGMTLIIIGFLLFGVLAFMSKENAALLPLLMLVVEFSLFRFATHGVTDYRRLIGFFLLIVVLPIGGFVLYNVINPDWIIDGYAGRNFSLSERLLTETRILWFYLQLLFFPDPAMLGFFHDDIVLSKDLLSPVSTLFALLGIIGLLVVAVLGRSRAPVLSFGILFFFVGHSMESTIFPLELAFEHRNYLPLLGPLFALFYYLLHPALHGRICILAVVGVTSFIALLMMVTADRASYWGDKADLYLTEAEHHPASPRANFAAGAVYLTRFADQPGDTALYKKARRHMEMVTALAPTNSQGLFGLIILHLHADRPVPEEWLRELEYRLRNVLYTPENINATQFMALVKYQTEENTTKLPENEVLQIFDAALSNPSLSSAGRAGIYSALATYHQEVLHKPKQALEYARRMVAARPESLEMRSCLINLLIVQNQFVAARKVIQPVEGIERDNRFKYEISRLKMLIDEAELSSKKH